MSDAVIMAAAVADFRPKAVATEKLKKGDGVPEIVLEPTADILAELGARKRRGPGRGGLRGRDPRTSQANAAAKLAAKKVDLMVANDVSADDAGFEVDTNRALVLDRRTAASRHCRCCPRRQLAEWLLERIVAHAWDEFGPVRLTSRPRRRRSPSRNGSRSSYSGEN